MKYWLSWGTKWLLSTQFRYALFSISKKFTAFDLLENGHRTNKQKKWHRIGLSLNCHLSAEKIERFRYHSVPNKSENPPFSSFYFSQSSKLNEIANILAVCCRRTLGIDDVWMKSTAIKWRSPRVGKLSTEWQSNSLNRIRFHFRDKTNWLDIASKWKTLKRQLKVNKNHISRQIALEMDKTDF